MGRTTVHRWGVHWAPGGIAYLHQTRGDQNAIGLREPSPFVVRPARRGAICNHLFQLNALNPAREHLNLFRSLLKTDSLVRYMLPLPREGGAVVVRKPNVAHLTMLGKMSSPVRKPVLWADFTDARTLSGLLEETDVQPLVLAGVQIKHMRMIEAIMPIAETTTRGLVIAPRDLDAPVRLPEVEAPTMTAADPGETLTLPWETLGAIVLRAYMRREWDPVNCWFTREPTPANEAKPSRPLPSERNMTNDAADRRHPADPHGG